MFLYMVQREIKGNKKAMKTSDFYYDLPQELIAQDPLEDRSASRLMHLDKVTGEIVHGKFRDILQYLQPGDCLVINDTKVLPARLYGRKVGTDAAIEILLLKRKEHDIWETLVKPGKKCKPGTVISFGEGLLTGEVLDVVEEGNRLIQFHYEGIFEEILDRLGEMPLPPYITHKLQDKNRYQTVYAKNEGSAAAPTAGLHFTGTAETGGRNGGQDCSCDAARRSWNLSSGKSGRCNPASHAFGILYCGRRSGEIDQ